IRRLADGVALHLEVDADDLAHLRVVVDEQDEGTARGLAGTRALEERLEVGALVAAVPARRIEGRHAAHVGPLADGALGDAEELGRLAERQPVAVASGRRALVARGHTANLPKCAASLHLSGSRSLRNLPSGGHGGAQT